MKNRIDTGKVVLHSTIFLIFTAQQISKLIFAYLGKSNIVFYFLIFFLFSAYLADIAILWILWTLGTNNAHKKEEKEKPEEFPEIDSNELMLSQKNNINDEVDLETELQKILKQEEIDADPLRLSNKSKDDDYD